ncbi:D-3-phosphoglycerate dehydrogenase [Mycobacterium kansasii]|uniref:2-oxoglutarate reductase n=1 Tax=Mycobacterium kansasii TaxID=1768 RepID=A0A1V3XRU3_MYCKA|nr:D-3-phosphoglycerate dehydrogenase [Mycobacterium kansasii]
MNLPVVLIADKLAQSTVAALGDQVEVRWVDGPDRAKLLAAVPEADALLVRSATTVDAEVLAAAPKLKIVARAGVGLDNVDVDAATARGVLVVNAPTSNIHSAAEHAIALLLAAARQIPAADATLRVRTWKRSSFSGTEIFGKTVGVVGLGRIGQLVAQRVAAFDAHVVAYDPYVSPARAAQLGIELLPLDDLLARADFISVHLPKTPETAGLIDKEALAKTKPGVIIVNAARGGLVDEAALADAIGGATCALPVLTCSPANRAPTARCSTCRRWSSHRTWVRPPWRPRTGPGPTSPRAFDWRWRGSSFPTRSTSAPEWSAKRWRPGWTWCASSECWPPRCPTARRCRCRYRFAVSLPPKRLRCCGFRRCAGCSRR